MYGLSLFLNHGFKFQGLNFLMVVIIYSSDIAIITVEGVGFCCRIANLKQFIS